MILFIRRHSISKAIIKLEPPRWHSRLAHVLWSILIQTRESYLSNCYLATRIQATQFQQPELSSSFYWLYLILSTYTVGLLLIAARNPVSFTPPWTTLLQLSLPYLLPNSPYGLTSLSNANIASIPPTYSIFCNDHLIILQFSFRPSVSPSTWAYNPLAICCDTSTFGPPFTIFCIIFTLFFFSFVIGSATACANNFPSNALSKDRFPSDESSFILFLSLSSSYTVSKHHPALQCTWVLPQQ